MSERWVTVVVSSGITVVLYFLLNFFGDVVLTPGTSPGAIQLFTNEWLLVVVVVATGSVSCAVVWWSEAGRARVQPPRATRAAITATRFMS